MRTLPILALGALLAVPTAHAQSIEGLGDLPGGSFYSEAYAVSADGTVVVGVSRSANGNEAFRWTAAEGMVGLGDLPGGDFESAAYAVSADGSVVVGTGVGTNGREAFRWTAAGGMESLGDLAGGEFESAAYGVASNGTVVVGASRGADGLVAVMWTQSGPAVALGEGTRIARAVSADGSVIAGSMFVVSPLARSTEGGMRSLEQAFRWTAAEGAVSLGALGGELSKGYGLSADGTTVVGWAEGDQEQREAFRWTAGGDMAGLGTLLDDEPYSEAYGVSDDGTVVVGETVGLIEGEEEDLAFVWSEGSGMRALQTALEDDYGLDLSDWQLLHRARAVSADGTVIVGVGDAAGGQQAFRVALGQGTPVEEAAAAPPSRLYAPHPNPALGTAALSYHLGTPGRVRLAVYDALGREVALLAEGPRPAGRHEAFFNGSGLPSGLYLVRMTTADGFVYTRRLTLLR